MFSWLSCKTYAQRASREMDGDLSLWDKPGYWLHHALCALCRRYRQQIHVIEKALSHLDDSLFDEDDSVCACSERHLSSEARERIKQALEAEKERTL